MYKNNLIKIVFVVLLSLVGLSLWFYLSFNGNPYSKFISEMKVQHYLRDTYPYNDFVIKSINYDFKSGTYNAEVISEKQKDINFIIWASTKGVKYDEYKYKYLEDKEQGEKFRSQIEEILSTLIKKEVNELDRLEVKMYVPKGKYEKDVKYTKDMDEGLKIFVSLHSTGEPKLTKEQFLTKAIKVREMILKNNFNLEYFNCYYLYHTKGDGYSLELYKDELGSKYEDLINSKRLVDYEELNKNKGRRF